MLPDCRPSATGLATIKHVCNKQPVACCLCDLGVATQVQGRISYRADTERPVGAGVTVEPASAALAQGLLEDYDRVVYEGEDFSPL